MFWVNLRPDAPEQVIDPYLEKTDLGKILLEADLQLKKDIARFTSPDIAEGRQYWTKVYAKAEELFGFQDMEIPTLTRPWIVPGEIIIRESPEGAFIYKAALKVMLEQDYLKDSPFYKFDDARLQQINEYSSQLIRQLIIPKLTREVNSSKRYAALRQVYYSLILAQWFKTKNKNGAGTDNKDLTGLASKIAWSKDTYYQLYQKSFQQGEYKKEEYINTPAGVTIRQYFSGGVAFEGGSLTKTQVVIRGIESIAQRLFEGLVSLRLIIQGKEITEIKTIHADVPAHGKAPGGIQSAVYKDLQENLEQAGFEPEHVEAIVSYAQQFYDELESATVWDIKRLFIKLVKNISTIVGGLDVLESKEDLVTVLGDILRAINFPIYEVAKKADGKIYVASLKVGISDEKAQKIIDVLGREAAESLGLRVDHNGKVSGFGLYHAYEDHQRNYLNSLDHGSDLIMRFFEAIWYGEWWYVPGQKKIKILTRKEDGSCRLSIFWNGEDPENISSTTLYDVKYEKERKKILEKDGGVLMGEEDAPDRGAMKKVGNKASDQDMESRRDEFEELARVSREEVVDTSTDQKAAIVVYADLGETSAYHFRDSKGKLVIVIHHRYRGKGAIVKEIIYHEVRESYWIQRGLSQREAHIVAWAEQIERFSKKGGLTPCHKDMLARMNKQDLRNLSLELRLAHYKLLEDVNRSYDAHIDVNAIITYEKRLKETMVRKSVLLKRINLRFAEISMDKEDVRELIEKALGLHEYLNIIKDEWQRLRLFTARYHLQQFAKKHPRSVMLLAELFGYRGQVENIIQGKIAIVIEPHPDSDHNTAFAGTRGTDAAELIRQGYNVFVLSVDSVEDMIRQIRGVLRTNKASLLVIGGHGSPTQLRLFDPETFLAKINIKFLRLIVAIERTVPEDKLDDTVREQIERCKTLYDDYTTLSRAEQETRLMVLDNIQKEINALLAMLVEKKLLTKIDATEFGQRLTLVKDEMVKAAERYMSKEARVLTVENAAMMAALNELLEDDAPLALVSCSTGKGENNLRDALVEVLKRRRVLAPAHDASDSVLVFEDGKLIDLEYVISDPESVSPIIYTTKERDDFVRSYYESGRGPFDGYNRIRDRDGSAAAFVVPQDAGAMKKMGSRDLQDPDGNKKAGGIDSRVLPTNMPEVSVPTMETRYGIKSDRQYEAILENIAETALAIARDIQKQNYDAVVISGGSSILVYQLIQAAWEKIASQPLKIHSLSRNENALLYPHIDKTGGSVSKLPSLLRDQILPGNGRDRPLVLYIDTHWDSGRKRRLLQNLNTGWDMKFAVFAARNSFNDIIGTQDDVIRGPFAVLAKNISLSIAQDIKVRQNGKKLEDENVDSGNVQEFVAALESSDRNFMDDMIMRINLKNVDGFAGQREGGSSRDLGGIDFRSMPMTGQQIQVGGMDMQKMAANSNIQDLDKEWAIIQRGLNRKSEPYSRIKEYWAVCCQRQDGGKFKKNVISFVMNILKLEEEGAVASPPEFKELLACMG